MRCYFLLSILVALFSESYSKFDDVVTIDIIDLAQPTSFADMSEYYGAVEKNWKICINCGVPGLGTAMHLEHEGNSATTMYPAVVPAEYLVTRMIIIDVTHLVKANPEMVLTLEHALEWRHLKNDPREPTLLLFKFGWSGRTSRSCVCRIPGISFELAEYISSNLTRVVAVATDAPTLESEQSREFNSKTVASILGRNGIYMIENVKIKQKLPETGCMAIAMPLKMEHKNYVPSRLTAFCPSQDTGGHQVVLALRKSAKFTDLPTLYPRRSDVDMADLM